MIQVHFKATALCVLTTILLLPGPASGGAVELVEVPITPAAIADPTAGADLSNARTFDLLFNVVPAPVPTDQFVIPSADTNGDGVVDITDIHIVQINMGLPGPEGDLDGSGLVDVRDIAIVASRFGEGFMPVTTKGILAFELTVILSGGGTVYQYPPPFDSDFEPPSSVFSFLPALEFDTYFPDWISDGAPRPPIQITTGLAPAIIMTPTRGLNESISALRLTVLGSDASGELSGRVLYENGSGSIFELNFTAAFTPQVLAGDLTGDGFVGINDLNIVLGNWNQNVPPGDPLADPSGDGFVGIDDLNTVLGNWNAGTPPETGAFGNVPEPSAGIILLLGFALYPRRPSSTATHARHG